MEGESVFRPGVLDQRGQKPDWPDACWEFALEGLGEFGEEFWCWLKAGELIEQRFRGKWRRFGAAVSINETKGQRSDLQLTAQHLLTLS